MHLSLMRWMNLEPIIQSKVSQNKKNKYCILMHIYGIYKDGVTIRLILNSYWICSCDLNLCLAAFVTAGIHYGLSQGDNLSPPTCSGLGEGETMTSTCLRLAILEDIYKN